MKRTARGWFLAALCAFALTGAAEEIILRDGRKLSGTITGVQGDIYRLETDFGVALIKKEWIARIEFSAAAGQEAEKPPSEIRFTPARPPAPPPAITIRERRPPGGRVEERIEGTTYINESFRFEMFRPPTWRILEQTARSIPSAVAVLGTSDETTLLIVGSVLYEGPPAAYAKILDSALRQNYSEFVAGLEEQVRVGGRPAFRRTFRGVAGGYEWHGLIVNMAEGAEHYGIIGVTRDEVFGFKEGVLAKMVNSFRFR